MDRELIKSAEQFHIRRRQRSAWKKLVSVLGCIVVFCTTYALILPAITMERETICGFREHQHSDSCYTQQVVKQMVCSAKDMGVHTHSAECGSSCGYADFMIHEHTAACYDDSGALVCTLSQVKEHTHSTDCYRIPQIVVGQHTHTDACYSMQQAELLCALTESDGHTHTEGCMSQISNLVCGQEESEEHAHSETCYSTEAVLSCEKEEIQAHHHAEDCYRWENKLSCGKEEGPIYGPGEPELICTQKEVEAHTHTAQCFNTDGNWICGQPQILRHVHTQSCFDTSQTEMVLTCDLEEHTHTQACFAEATETTEETTEATEETTEVTEETTEATEETTEVTEETTEATEETTEATEETTEATEETTEATEEEQTMPAQSFQGLTESNVVVLADADAGAFPAGTTMYASDVAVATARKLAEETADEDTEILDAVGVNITFRDAEGTIIEPENGALVRVNIALPEEKKLEGDDFSLLHRHNDGTVETVENAEVTSDGAGFTTESFSVYIVTALGNKDKDEVHASFNPDNPLYHNGPYDFWHDINRPYVLQKGDSVKILFDYPATEGTKDLSVYYVNRTRSIVTVTNEDQTTLQKWEYKFNEYEKLSSTNNGNNDELSVTITSRTPKPDDANLTQIEIRAEGKDTHNIEGAKENYSLYVITLGDIANVQTETIPPDQQNIYIRVTNGVYVEDVSRGDDNFRNYYDHADLEIDNTGHFTGTRIAYYPDRYVTEQIIYKADVQRVDRCTLYDASNQPITVQYCSERPDQAWVASMCVHDYNTYDSTLEKYKELTYIESSRYVDGNASPTQYEYTSKYGHLRFPTNVAKAEFVFDLVLIPDTIDGEPATETEKEQGMMSFQNKEVTLLKTSVVDAYNYCPDHSGLDFHIGGDMGTAFNINVSPAFVVLSAKKVLQNGTLAGNDFKFVLKDSEGHVLQTVTNDAEGQIVFAGITYTSAGTYNYTIQEEIPTTGKPGVSYDNRTVEVEVVISPDENGKLTASVAYGYSGGEKNSYWGLPSQIVFTNEYVEGNLTIQKNVVGKAVDPTERFHLTIRRMDGAFIDWSKFTVESDKDRSIALSGNDYQNYLDIYGGEQITIHGLPVGQYSIQEWGAPATVVYTKVTEQGEVDNQSKDPLWSNPREPNDPKGWWYFAGVVELTAEASNATQRITNKFCKLAVTKRVVGDKAPADVTSYKVKITRESVGSIDWRVVKATSSIGSKTVDLTVNKTNPQDKDDQGYSVSFMLVKDETVTLTNLPVGTYKVVEEDPLTGVLDVDYSTDKGEVTLIAGSTVSETITNWYPNSYILPETGGPGTGRYTLGGFTMAAGAVLWLCYRRKRRREDG